MVKEVISSAQRPRSSATACPWLDASQCCVFMNQNELRKQAQELVNFCQTNNRPLIPDQRPEVYENPELVRCGCGTYQPISSMAIRSTGVLQFIDNICPKCAEQDKGMARIVCAGCRTVVARMSPHKDQYGFSIVAGHYYHVDRCPGCAPEQTKSIIIEKVIFMRKKFGPQWTP